MYHYNNIFENEFAKIYHYPKIDTVGHIWLPETTQLLFGEEYREQIQIFMDFCDKYSPSQLLFDIKEGEFTIDLESQKWLQEIVYPAQKKQGVKRKAYVVKPAQFDLLSIAVKQTAEEDIHQFFDFKYFSITKEALQWLSEFINI